MHAETSVPWVSAGQEARAPTELSRPEPLGISAWPDVVRLWPGCPSNVDALAPFRRSDRKWRRSEESEIKQALEGTTKREAARAFPEIKRNAMYP